MHQHPIFGKKLSSNSTLCELFSFFEPNKLHLISPFLSAASATIMTGNHHHRGHHHRRHHNLQPLPQPPPLPPPPLLLPTFFHLLEITIISAQNLSPSCVRTQAYAQAWIEPDCKLRTRVDRIGATNPDWNDRLIFKVNSNFLRSATAAVTIDIRRVSLLTLNPNPIIGTSRLILSTVKLSSEIQFVALQIRRPKSLRPQGILNLGVAVYNEATREALLRGFKKESEKSDEIGRWMVDVEREALRLKLEKWRAEITPVVAADSLHRPSPEREEAAAKRRFLGCLFGGRR